MQCFSGVFQRVPAPRSPKQPETAARSRAVQNGARVGGAPAVHQDGAEPHVLEDGEVAQLFEGGEVAQLLEDGLRLRIIASLVCF